MPTALQSYKTMKQSPNYNTLKIKYLCLINLCYFRVVFLLCFCYVFVMFPYSSHLKYRLYKTCLSGHILH